MSKLCSVCGTENRDEAQFCRACGTAFSAAKAASAADGTASNVCAECGFQNKPGIRYCANCGMSLAGSASAASGEAATPAADDAYASGPPPISYPSFATVSPYPTAHDTDHSSLFDQQATPDIPDPDAAIALRQQEGYESHGDTTVGLQSPPAPNRAPLILGGVVALLVIAGVAAWLFMGTSNPAPPVAAPTPTSVTPPVASTPPPAPTSAPPVLVEEAAPANAPTVAASGTTAPTATLPPPAAAVPLGTPPAAAAPLPQLGDPAVESAEAEAKRLSADKRREKAAKDKSDREAKAKAAAERDQVSAAQRAEQEAQAKRRAEEAQRARSSTAAPPMPAPAPVAQARGVREICAGRGTIAEAVCQSRQCGLPEHANEQICRQLREADERRRNMQN